ncbi:MAG TPA: Gfo/Idh/MocA family oxidoreductase [Thermoanaerobaculia bacterium]|jgi:predicted dehydrogenase|nr:Gfo/Idh/MocA family oxidoreductase [Thermoanaerobaculia bacterium]
MVRIGIVGAGWGARVQAPAFREAGLEVVAVAGSRDDWRALVNSPEVDLITITTPPSEHREMAIAALAAGKHVLCEKPTALDAGEAEAMLAAAREHPEQLALIDHELRFLPSFRAARERIGELDGVRYVEVRYSSPGRGDRTRGWNWWSDAQRGGGVLGAVGSHLIDATRYLVDEVESVQAMLATVIAERPFDGGMRKVTSDDFASLSLRLRGGAAAAMTISAVAGGADEPTTITIHGERGAFRLVGEELLFAKRGESFARIAGNDMADRPGNSPGGAFGTGTLLLGQALKAALDDGDRDALKPAATFEDGLAQQQVLDAARRSAANDGVSTRPRA